MKVDLKAFNTQRGIMLSLSIGSLQVQLDLQPDIDGAPMVSGGVHYQKDMDEVVL